jgi:signal transduction histidine kinase
MIKMNKMSFLSKKSIIYTVLIIGIFILIIFNFMGWFFIKNLENDILQQLKTQLSNLGSVSTRLINGEELEGLYPGDETNPVTLYYQQLLWEIKRSGNLENILIISLDKKLLIDYRIEYNIGDTLSTFPVNDAFFNQAILGQTPEPELIQSGGEYYLTSYTPIKNQVIGNTVAVLILEAPANFFSTLQYFKSGIFYFGIGGLAVIIIFSGIIILSLRQLLRIENKLQEQERLAQLGQMAAMVAHEIRNPLSIIKGSADVLQKKYSSENEELFTFIPDEIDRLNRLVNDFLQFARKRQLNFQNTNPNHLIQSTISQIKDNKIKLDLAENCPEIPLDQDAFKQIILNIVDNGIKALNENGEIQIKTEIQNKFIITIEDNGKGMSPEMLKDIFKPFYSNRASGSGLGMTITKQLAEGMNGKINIKSKLNKGTTVSLEFPLQG